MTVRLDLNGLLATAVGAGGLTAEDLAALEPDLARVRGLLAERRADGKLAFAELPYRSEDLHTVRAAAAEAREHFDTLVVLGVGGSALGARALASALVTPATGGMRVVLADSIDPAAMQALLDQLDLRRTLFNVVSKSGNTAGTMAQFLVVRDRLLRALGAVDYKRHLLITTDPERGSLRQVVNDEGFRELVIPAGVQGRLATLSAVGLFPLAAAGLDIADVLAGAALVDERSQAAAGPLTDAPLMLAGALWLLATRREKRLLALVAGSDRLAGVGDWFCHLWAASLGRSAAGALKAIPARGAADQHAELALSLDGPRDTVVVFVRVEDHGAPLDVPVTYQDLEDVGYLGGHPLAELLDAEQRATELALARHGRPSARITLPALNPFTVGQLVYLLEVATVAAGVLAGIDPGEEHGLEEARQIAHGLMGRPRFAGWREEAEAWLGRKDPRFVL
jgi:glucose-6-phosphate isomerase